MTGTDHPHPPSRRAPRALAMLALLGPAALVLTACSGGPAQGGGSGSGASLDVYAEFYPLAFAVEEIGGDLVSVTNMTKPGAEPHDLELSPKELGQLQSADLVVYAADMSAAVDDGITSHASSHALDVARFADLQPFGGTELPTDSGDDHDHADHDDADHDHADHDDADHDHGALDPHFWLDPVRYADVAQAIAAELERIDPDHADAYRENAADLDARLHELDDSYRTGLAQCTQPRMVTAHSAFGYLADRYGLTQVGISGLSAEAEPTPGRLAEIAHYVREHDITTIYTEVLMSPKIAETLASETGARNAVLDPLEGLTDASPGDDYFEVMQANLTTLEEGQGCS